MRRPLGLACALGLACGMGPLAASCGEGARTFEGPTDVRGEAVPAEVLNRGEFVYMQQCRGCHGAEGRGDGPYASSMEPAPADLTTGAYRRLAPVTHAAMKALIAGGIEGTAMGPQRASGEQLDAVAYYALWLGVREDASAARRDQRVQ